MTLTSPRRQSGRLLVVGLLLCLTVACTPPVSDGPVARVSAEPREYAAGTPVPDPYPMPAATLTDTSGLSYNLHSSPSKPVTLLFFGYTHCPDVCVGVLSDMALALHRLSDADRDQIQLVFVTTDPARDNGRVIRSYLDRFDPDFLGLTGELSAIKGAAARVGVDIEGTNRLPDGGYEVGHSAQVIGFDRHHRGVVLWTPSCPVADLAADFRHLVAEQQ